MKNILGWEQFNESINENRDDIFGGHYQEQIAHAEKMLSDLISKIKKKVNLRDIGKRFIDRFRKPSIEVPIATDGPNVINHNEPEYDAPSNISTGLILSKRDDEVNYINYVSKNFDILRWVKPVEANFLLSLAKKNIEENGDLKLLQDLCLKINNNIER